MYIRLLTVGDFILLFCIYLHYLNSVQQEIILDNLYVVWF